MSKRPVIGQRSAETATALRSLRAPSMNESRWTQAILTQFRQRRADAHVIKFNDRTTAGIPDALVIHQGRHIWIEFKVARSDKTDPLSLLSQVQREHFLKMVKRGASVLVAVKFPSGPRVTQVKPDGRLEEMDWTQLLDLTLYLRPEYR